MSFKSLQNRLFQMGGSQAVPLRSNPSVIDNSATNYTASCDGWLYWIMSCPAQAASFSLHINGQNMQCVFDPDIGGNRTMLVPIKKGDTANFIKTQVGEVFEEYRCLFKLVGGGLRVFISWFVRGFKEVGYAL